MSKTNQPTLSLLSCSLWPEIVMSYPGQIDLVLIMNGLPD